jgi:endonuclease YncB( thermonuclease family)
MRVPLYLIWIGLVTYSCSGRARMTPAEMRSSRPRACSLWQWEDGDTPYVKCGAAAARAVRLVGIDTPESAFDENSRRRGLWQAHLWHLSTAQVFACGQAATRRAKELCPEGSAIELIAQGTDKYDRLLGTVFCRDLNLNARLLQEGLAGRYAYPALPQRPTACPSVVQPH